MYGAGDDADRHASDARPAPVGTGSTLDHTDDTDLDDAPRLGLPAALFALTVASTLLAGALYEGAIAPDAGVREHLVGLTRGWRYAVPLLAILLGHEFGHYVAARIHRVPATLPHFLPAPWISPFGTMGAVIGMSPRIRSRAALLDIGAAGPLVGLAIALPVLVVGLATSKVEPLTGPYVQEGQSLLYLGLKRLVVGPIPNGHDVTMNATAFAGWTGLFVTALNLLPVGQLDGGHIAYAWLGERQNRIARWLHGALLLAFAYNVARFVFPAITRGGSLEQAVGNSTFWLVWFAILALLRWRTGMNHPPTDGESLPPARRAIAIACMVLFALLFMPTPWARYDGP
jgi:membrane-associated protease RseP (regulator of RpoE activity)